MKKRSDGNKRLRKASSVFFSAVLALGICIPQGAITALAEEQDASAAVTDQDYASIFGEEANAGEQGSAAGTTAGTEQGTTTGEAGSAASAAGTAGSSSTGTATGTGNATGTTNPAASTTASATQGGATIYTLADPTSDSDESIHRIALSNIVENDTMYTTLVDTDGKIISTNDPEQTQDGKYANGGTLDLGQSVNVSFRMSKINPYDGTDKGIQETDSDGKIVVYHMDLPQELVPTAMTDDGKSKLVNPDTPYVFFQYGEVKAVGGIYNKKGTTDEYELDIMFSNVVDKIDITGGLQYSATVSDSLVPGQNVNVVFNPGGVVKFKVTPTPEPEKKPAYDLDVTANSFNSDNTINWTVTLTDNQDQKKLPNTKVHLDMSSGHAIWWRFNDRNVGNLFTVTVTYTDGTTKDLTGIQMGMSKFYYFDPSKVSFDGNLRWIEINFDDYCTTTADGYTYSGGNKQKLINGFDILYGGYNAGTYDYRDQPNDIAKVEVKYQTNVIDNYNVFDNSYTTTGTATIDGEDYRDTGGTGKGYGMASVSLSHSNSSTRALGNLWTERENTINVNQNSIGSNLFEFEYKPSVSNSTNGYWYFCPWSFYGRSSLAGGSNGNSFTKFTVGDISSWTYMGTVDWSYYSKPATDNDMILQYQIQQMFPDNYNSLSTYRSSTPVNGKYVFIIIDPESYQLAYSETDRSALTETPVTRGGSDGTNVNKPASFKMYVFNAPYQNMTISFKEQLGASMAEAGHNGGSITNQVVYTSAHGSNTSTSDGDGTGTQAMVSAHGQWATDDVIRWDVYLDARGLTKRWVGSGYETWRTSSFRFKLSGNQSLMTSPYTDSEGNTYYPNALYVASTNGGSDYQLPILHSGVTSSFGASLDDSNTKSALPYSGSSNYVEGYDGSQYTYEDSNGIIHYYFFTKVGSRSYGSQSASADFTMQPEIDFMTGNVTSNDFGNGASVYPVKTVGQEVHATTPGAFKSVKDIPAADQTADDTGKIAEEWTIALPMTANVRHDVEFNRYDRYGSSQSPDYKLMDGYYSGTLNIHDDMTQSAVKNADGSPAASTAKPGSYTKLTSMHISGGGPLFSTSSLSGVNGAKIDNGSIAIEQSDIDAAMASADHSVTKEYVAYSSYGIRYNVKVTLAYSGNMEDGFDLKIEGLQNFAQLNVYYDTEFDEAAFAKASSSNATASFGIDFTNGASLSSWNPSSSYKASATVSHSFNAALSIAKEPGSGDVSPDGYCRDYTITTTLGYMPVPAIEVTDFLMSYDDVSLGDTKITYAKKSALDALGNSMQIDPNAITITAKDPTMKEEQTVYADGQAQNGWKVEYNREDGFKLFVVDLSKADGSNIMANTVFTIKYAADLNPDTVVGQDAAGNDVTFRKSVYYGGHAIDIHNNAEGMIQYGSTGGDGNSDTSGTSTDDTTGSDTTGGSTSGAKAASFDAAEGAGSATAAASTTAASASATSPAATAAAGSAIKTMGISTLAVDPTSQEAYDAEPDMDFSWVTNRIDDQTGRLHCYAGPGAEARYLEGPTIDKEPTKVLSSSAIKLPSYPENNNLRYYGTGTTSWTLSAYNGQRGKDASDFVLADGFQWQINDVYELGDSEPTALQSQVISTLQSLLKKHTSYSNLKIYYDASNTGFDALQTQNPIYTYDGVLSDPVTNAPTTLDGTTVTASVDSDKDLHVKLSGDDVNFGQNAVITYDLSVDWDAFYEEAVKATVDGRHVVDPETFMVMDSHYSVMPDSIGNDAMISGSDKVSKGESTLYLDSTTLNKESTAVDKANGTASWSVDAKVSAVASDHLSLEDAVDIADEKAANATSIQNVKVTLDGNVIYDGSQDNPYAEGWSADNLTVNVDGLRITALVKNTADKTVLISGQDYKLTYDTVLDKQAYAAAGAKAGDTYDMSNAAMLHMGSVSLTSTAFQSFEPNMPVTASKVNNGNPDGQVTTTSWTATAGSGEVDRQGFEIMDAVSADAAVAPYLSVTSFNVKVTDAQGNETTYDSQSLPEGVTLTQADGSSFALDQNGQSSFKLKYDTLPAGNTVEVNYNVTLDKDAYISAGGQKDVPLTLSNAMHAGGTDGYTAEATQGGTVSVPTEFGKSGQYAEKDPSGAPIYVWKLDVNLLSNYTAEELAKLDEVTVTDELGPATPYLYGSMQMFLRTTTADGTTVSDTPVDPSEYKVDQDGNKVSVTVDPKKYQNFQLVFRTVLLTNIENMKNTAELTIDGKTTKASDTPTPGPRVLNESAYISSYTVPEFTPNAYKFLDGKLLTGNDYVFNFRAQGVDENGNVIEQGKDGYYDSTAQNDENGNVMFDAIKYLGEGTHYYLITETGLGLAQDNSGNGVGYTTDAAQYLIKVVVQKLATRYDVTSSIVSATGGSAESGASGNTGSTPENATFYNQLLKNRDLTVTKTWDDAQNAAGIRPQSVTVHLLKDGAQVESVAADGTVTMAAASDTATTPVDGTTTDGTTTGDAQPGTVTLSDANNWTYTWTGLAVDGSTYSVSEDPVIGYDSKVGELTLSQQPGENSAGAWAINVTNTQQKTAGLSVTKHVKGGTDADKTKAWHFTVTLTDGQYISGKFGDLEFKSGVAEFDLTDGQTVFANGLPNGMSYTVAEDDYSSLNDTVTSTGETGKLSNEMMSNAQFTNTLPTPETPVTPNTPTTPGTPGTTSGNGGNGTTNTSTLAKTSDEGRGGMIAATAMFVAGCAVLAVCGYERKRRGGRSDAGRHTR